MRKTCSSARVAVLFLIGLVFLLVLAGCQAQDSKEKSASTSVAEKPASLPSDQVVAVIATDKGKIVLEFLTEGAPKAVENFRTLAEDGFYDRTTFHRIKTGQFIQGGDPLSRDSNPWNDGQGNSGKFLKAEYSKHKFSRGSVAMTRLADAPDSSSCQFFIMLMRAPQMDGEYTAFARVVEGIEIAETISKVRTNSDPRAQDRPAAPQKIKSISIEPKPKPVAKN